MNKFVAYYRVSTVKQSQSGLGLDAQNHSVNTFINGQNGVLIAQFTEIETGKGADALEKRPKLNEAIQLCRKQKATLLIAKLDRLARNVHFVTGLIECGCNFIAVDMPHANKVMLQIHAVMSEYERDQISIRTKNALAEAKKRGIRLGTAGCENLKLSLQKRIEQADDFAISVAPTIQALINQGLSQRKVVQQLNQSKLPSSRGGKWSLIQLQRVLARIN